MDENCRRVLADRALRLGVSPHELARYYVIEALEDSEERAAIREALLALRKDIQEARQDVAVSTEALLATAGKVSASEAKAWTKQNVNSPS